MKLYQGRQRTNPRRVTIYLAEKGIELERVEVTQSEIKSERFLAMNPAGRVPVLELEDGTYLSESAAIVEYLEELHPDPPMIGTNPATRGRVRALERIGNDLIVRTGLWLARSLTPPVPLAVTQAALAESLRPSVDELLLVLEKHIGARPFLAGEAPTIADCTLFPLFQTCRTRFGLPFGSEYPRLDAWYARFADRPSAAYR
jgi:glutathione S-transferase